MRRAPRLLLGLILLAGTARNARSQAAPVPGEPQRQVLVLGSFHMANPGLDVVNAEVDDMLSARRQAEIAEVVAVLRRFRPTKVLVEREPGRKSYAEKYSAFLVGGYDLTRNEDEQIGFRVAKAMGHDSIFGVDADGEFPYPRVQKFARATGREAELDSLNAALRHRVEAFERYLASHSVLEALLEMNSEVSVRRDVGEYYGLAHLSERWDWAGADLLASWFRRNAHIYSNTLEHLDAPDERVLVIFGAGHLGWLQRMFEDDQTVRLRRLAEFVD